ncbi:hypothetical protein EB118_06305 [bacterium]|nr:hypothetical protein [bacterium]NBX98432.1 hypothetical protein [bacterium]NDC94349.1 hypothetical protein [bacterium]NDD83821.1 hypothetical protein [bacterium]NDG29690.1 hypothetical protein [bacterium]
MNESIQTFIITVNTLLVLSLFMKSKPQSSGKKKASLVLDTCALIDGRIKDIYSTGIVNTEVVVPQFILRELQMLADGSDNHKRSRARYGLDIAESLREQLGSLYIVDDYQPGAATTDDKLLLLAKKRGAILCTTDYNLNKVAANEGVIVFNVNELAHAMRPNFLPGEEQEVKLLQKGESRGQAVGYLEDGTMVVVDNAAHLLQTKQVVVIERSLQTLAGKMSFAHLKNKSKRIK